jgi:hypothetical protein
VSRLERVIAAAVALLPLLVGATGHEVGFTMYAESVDFRVEIVARDPSGGARTIGPTALAARVTPSAVPFLAGSDHFRRTYGELPLRHQLGALARLACAEDGRAAEVEVTLFERRRGAVRASRERVSC